MIKRFEYQNFWLSIVNSIIHCQPRILNIHVAMYVLCCLCFCVVLFFRHGLLGEFFLLICIRWCLFTYHIAKKLSKFFGLWWLALFGNCCGQGPRETYLVPLAWVIENGQRILHVWQVAHPLPVVEAKLVLVSLLLWHLAPLLQPPLVGAVVWHQLLKLLARSEASGLLRCFCRALWRCGWCWCIVWSWVPLALTSLTFLVVLVSLLRWHLAPLPQPPLVVAVWRQLLKLVARSRVASLLLPGVSGGAAGAGISFVLGASGSDFSDFSGGVGVSSALASRTVDATSFGALSLLF